MVGKIRILFLKTGLVEFHFLITNLTRIKKSVLEKVKKCRQNKLLKTEKPLVFNLQFINNNNNNDKKKKRMLLNIHELPLN